MSLSCPSLGASKLPDLPVEVVARIVQFATASRPLKTYTSLIFASSQMQAIVYTTCFSHLPIMLHTRNQVLSFQMLLQSHPDIGPSVRMLWFIAGIKSSEEVSIGRAILSACPLITRLACKTDLLRSTITSTSFSLDHLRDLMLIEPFIPWAAFLAYPNGRQLFSQLTHFRSSGGRLFTFPDFCFTSLTHLSFSCHDLATLQFPTIPVFDQESFPVLKQIVPTIPFMVCRSQDSHALRSAGRKSDARVDVIPCPKKWKEADMWETAAWGLQDIWERAALASDLVQALNCQHLTQGPSVMSRQRRYYDEDPFDEDPFDEYEWYNIRNAMEG
jgi:hypothetical protein